MSGRSGVAGIVPTRCASSRMHSRLPSTSRLPSLFGLSVFGLLSALLLLLSLCLSPSPAHALLEEQVGQIDWHVSHLGNIVGVVPRVKDDTWFVASSQGALASLALGGARSGETLVKQTLPDGEKLQSLAPYSNLRALLLSSVCVVSAAPNMTASMVRTINTRDGTFGWEATLLAANNEKEQQNKESSSSFSGGDVLRVWDATGDGKADVMVLHGNSVSLLSGVDGEVVWTWSKAGFSGFRLSALSQQAAVIGQEQSGTIVVYVLESRTGKEIQSRSLPFSPSPSPRNLALVFDAIQPCVLLLDPSSQVLSLSSLFLTGAAAKKVDMVLKLSEHRLAASAPATHLDHFASSATASYIALHAPGSQIILEVTANGAKAVNRFTSKEGEETVFAVQQSETDLSALQLVRASLVQDKLTVSTFKMNDASNQPLSTLLKDQPFPDRGGLKQLWVEGARVAVSAGDDSFSLIEGGKIKWTREEGLASMHSLQFVELPVGGTAAAGVEEDSGVYPNFFQRVGPQLLSMVGGLTNLLNPLNSISKVQKAVEGLQNNIEALTQGQEAAAPTVTALSTFSRPLPAEEAAQLAQDHFGFRKLLLSTTSSGKVYALDSSSGRVVWGKFLRLPNQPRITHVQRIVVLAHHEAVALVQEQGEGKAQLIACNTLTGEVLPAHSLSLPFHVSSLITVPFVDSHNRHVLLAASAPATGAAAEKVSVQVFPDTAEAKQLLTQHASEVFFYQVDKVQSVARGYGVQAKGAAFEGVESWAIRFPAEERIDAVSARSPSEHVLSSVRILGGGEGGFLYKYLNPNLLSIATVRTLPSSSDQQKSKKRVVPSLKRSPDPSVNLYLLDAVTGAVLDKFVHRGCEGPVTMVQSENSVLYHYFNAGNLQYEVSAVELFENRGGTTTGAGSISPGGSIVTGASSILHGLSLSSLARLGRSSVPAFDSFSEPAPQSLQQTFTFPGRMKTLGVSHTRRGITSKEYLIGLASDQLYAMPKALVDPRRPIADPTQQDKMEGLIPYTPHLPVDKLRVVSHLHTIAHLRGVSSTSALLESTSIVCAYGLDLFCTRVHPSQTFDLLNQDFNSPFLIATVTAVFGAIMWARRLAREKELAKQWK